MSNTYAASLTTAQLIQEAVTPLQHIAAPLKAFSRVFTTDRYKPKATSQVKFVVSAGTSQKNPTTFESGDSEITNKEIPVDHISLSWQVSSADLNSGLRMADLVTIHARKFAQELVGVALSVVTEANFKNYNGGSYVSAAPAFGWPDMALMWGALKKAPEKNAVLDGEYLGMLVNSPTYLQQAPTGANQSGAQFGWNGLYLNTDWSAAGSGVRGVICSPNAVGVVAGYPLVPALATTLDSAEMVVPGLDLPVQLNRWFSLASRTQWMSLDVMLGAVALDVTAGVLIKTP